MSIRSIVLTAFPFLHLEDGHVKLTDFGLSRIDTSWGRRDLELSDLINVCSPNRYSRTPGQLLSLTSHLSFGSHEKKASLGSLMMKEKLNSEQKETHDF